MKLKEYFTRLTKLDTFVLNAIIITLTFLVTFLLQLLLNIFGYFAVGVIIASPFITKQLGQRL